MTGGRVERTGPARGDERHGRVCISPLLGDGQAEVTRTVRAWCRVSLTTSGANSEDEYLPVFVPWWLELWPSWWTPTWTRWKKKKRVGTINILSFDKYSHSYLVGKNRNPEKAWVR